jgi:hypothetical protein
MVGPSGDQPVLSHIEKLAAEEHRLYEKETLSDDERVRLRQINVGLDQRWNLLRQRRALREYGRDPDEAALRWPGVVEEYEAKYGKEAEPS